MLTIIFHSFFHPCEPTPHGFTFFVFQASHVLRIVLFKLFSFYFVTLRQFMTSDPDFCPSR